MRGCGAEALNAFRARSLLRREEERTGMHGKPQLLRTEGEEGGGLAKAVGKAIGPNGGVWPGGTEPEGTEGKRTAA